jgi:hypothetical protein
MFVMSSSSSELKHRDLILLPIGHPQKPLTINIKIESGVELAYDLLVPVIILDISS